MSFQRLTPFPELDKVLRDQAVRLQGRLGDFLIGVYLVGSLAIGDFDLTSDIDFIVVTRGELSKAQRDQVQLVHDLTFAQDNRWVKHLEYSFFPVDRLNVPSSPFDFYGRRSNEGRELWHFDHGGETLERSDHDNSLVVRWTLRERAVTVIGPSPSTFINSIPVKALRTEIRNTLVGWGEELLKDPAPYRNRFFQAFIVLHFCRMLQDLEKGSVTSKLQGAKWARRNLDSKWIPLIDYCWNERQDSEIHISQPAVTDVFANVLDFVDYAVTLGKDFTVG